MGRRTCTCTCMHGNVAGMYRGEGVKSASEQGEERRGTCSELFYGSILTSHLLQELVDTSHLIPTLVHRPHGPTAHSSLLSSIDQ